MGDMRITVTETYERQSLALRLARKIGFSGNRDACTSVATAVAIAFCEKAAGYEIMKMDMEKFRVQFDRGAFVVVTDAAFVPVLEEIQNFVAKTEDGTTYYLKVSDDFEVTAKEKRNSSFLWAHVTLQAGATDSDETIEQTIRSCFKSVGFAVTDFKPMRDSYGFSTGKFHVAFDRDGDAGLNGTALKRLKNISLPSGLVAYTNFSKEFLEKFNIRKCCFALMFDHNGNRNAPCTCTGSNKGARVGDKRTNERAALARMVSHQLKQQKK